MFPGPWGAGGGAAAALGGEGGGAARPHQPPRLPPHHRGSAPPDPRAARRVHQLEVGTKTGSFEIQDFLNFNYFCNFSSPPHPVLQVRHNRPGAAHRAATPGLARDDHTH